MYRNFWTLFIKFFYLTFLLIVVSCVPKATEKKAVCGTNEKFNSVTRTCYSVAAIRYTPVGTLSTQTLTQETSALLNLTYTDANADSAISCTVSGVSSNLEVFSPVISDGSLLTKANDLKSAIGSLKTVFDMYYAANVNASTLAAKTTIDADVILINTYISEIQYSYYIPTIDTNSVNVQNKSSEIITAVAPFISNTTVNYYYTLAQTRLTEFQTYYTSMTNKCFCSGGVCKTYVVPKKGFYGLAGFSYTIADIDGTSSIKSTSLTVNAYSNSTSHYTPAVEPVYTTGVESNTSDSEKYAFTLGTGRDYFGTSTFTYAHNKTVKSGVINGYSTSSVTYVDSDTALGKVTACLGLGGSTASDKSCYYIPNDGDAYSSSAAATASLTLGDISLVAKANGLGGNNISVKYVNLNSDYTLTDPYSTSGSKYGMVDSTEAYLRVYGNAIYVFFREGITTTATIQSLIANDMVAKTLVTATGGSGALASLATASSAQYLSGGLNAYDVFSYTINNGYLTSSSAQAVFDITAVNDIPKVPNAYTGLPFTDTKTLVEDTLTQSVDLVFKDVDTVAAASFSFTAKIDPSVPTCSTSLSFADFSSMVTSTNFNITIGAGLPTIGVTENTKNITIDTLSNFVGNACLYYVVNDGTSNSSVQQVQLSVTAVNDTPTLTMNSYTVITSAVPSTTGASTTTMTMNENSTSAPSSAYVCMTAAAGGGSDEATQTLTYTVTQEAPTSDASLVLTFTTKAPGASGSSCSATQTMISWVPTANYSGTTNIKIDVVDNGKTNSVNDFKTVTHNIALTVTPVNDPPYFATSVSNVESNEGGYVIAGPFKVDEDTANSTDENSDGMYLNITSDNQSILMDSSIKIFYDLNDNGVEDTLESRANNAMLETAAGNDSKLHNFYLKLTPVGGTSGSANITISATDDVLVVAPAKTKTHTFSFVVNPVAAIHGGWDNISAIGLKTDKSGAPANSNDIACNYNKSTDTNNCNGGSNCTGTTAPFSAITTTAANVLYWDSSNLKCYYSYANPISGGTPAYLWKQFNTSCPVTRVSTQCSGNNCLINGVNGTAPDAIDQYYYNLTAGTCHKSVLTGSTYSWDTVPYYPSKVTLDWKTFTLSGSGLDLINPIKGYNVYRREAGNDYDFKNGFLKPTTSATISVSGTSTLTYTDTTAQAGKVYYYTVRPVDTNHNFATYTPEIYSEIRLVAPPRNYSFVHRWMVNQEVCNKMHMTTTTTNKVDPSRNFRCPYYGPGSNAGYYDYGKDLLVDMSEMGCPYTLNSGGGHCTNGSNGCIGIGKPNPYLVGAVSTTGDLTLSTAVANDVYYDRSGGSCYIYNGSDWIDYNDSTNLTSAMVTTLISSGFTQFNSALNPPMVKINQSQASNVCSYRTPPTIYKNSSTAMAALPNFNLPEKKDYMAYSAAPTKSGTSVISETQIADLEKGDSLNVQSRCNGSGASGLTDYYTESSLPTSSYIFSLPGTASSGIRSLYTGSVPWGFNKGTESCVSRYGVQDVYGNVAEWTKDRMLCDTSTYVCASTSGTDLHHDFVNSGAYHYYYALDLILGPFNDSNGSGVGGDTFSTLTDSFLTEWDIADETFDATKFSFPLGIPMYTNFSTLIKCPYTKYALGNCSYGTLGCVGSGDPDSMVFDIAPVNGNVYLDHSSGKCYDRAGGAWTLNTAYTAPTVAGVDFILDIGSSNGITYSQLHGDGMIINGDDVYAGSSHIGGFAVGGSYLSGSRSGRYTTELVPEADTRPDVGFRCIMPIDSTKYDTTDPFHTYSY